MTRRSMLIRRIWRLGIHDLLLRYWWRVQQRGSWTPRCRLSVSYRTLMGKGYWLSWKKMNHSSRWFALIPRNSFPIGPFLSFSMLYCQLIDSSLVWGIDELMERSLTLSRSDLLSPIQRDEFVVCALPQNIYLSALNEYEERTRNSSEYDHLIPCIFR